MNPESAVTLGTSLVASDYRSGERPNRMSRQRSSLAGGPSDRLAGSSAHLKLGSTPTCGIESEERKRGTVESFMSIQLICGEGVGSGRVTSVNMNGGASRCDRTTRVRTTAPCFSYGDLVRPKIGVYHVLPAGERSGSEGGSSATAITTGGGSGSDDRSERCSTSFVDGRKHTDVDAVFDHASMCFSCSSGVSLN